jgi:hypothetical protein
MNAQIYRKDTDIRLIPGDFIFLFYFPVKNMTILIL